MVTPPMLAREVMTIVGRTLVVNIRSSLRYAPDASGT
jgi:hypothetical protein